MFIIQTLMSVRSVRTTCIGKIDTVILDGVPISTERPPNLRRFMDGGPSIYGDLWSGRDPQFSGDLGTRIPNSMGP